eukprot:TRINITY_DN778243_c0_g1_i1.p1 TRINITY_DN778243_c0_g1~~TRINITY_DN778243_c0_g1_i1.p1  ORF type:complete len:441 (+),score=117.51 TRINITY_DN778243_c0_g1_i1:48-1370(+)
MDTQKLLEGHVFSRKTLIQSGFFVFVGLLFWLKGGFYALLGFISVIVGLVGFLQYGRLYLREVWKQRNKNNEEEPKKPEEKKKEIKKYTTNATDSVVVESSKYNYIIDNGSNGRQREKSPQASQIFSSHQQMMMPMRMMQPNSGTYLTGFTRFNSSSASQSSPTFDLMAANQILTKLGIETKIEIWSDSLKRFIASKMTQIIEKFDSNSVALQRFEVTKELLNYEKKTQSSLATYRNISLSELIIRHENDAIFASQTDPNLNLLKERKMLEQYINIPNCSDFGYVLSRIRTLASGGHLASFRYDSSNSSSALSSHKATLGPVPTDAEIVFHFFCAMMNHFLPSSHELDVPFFDNFVKKSSINSEEGLSPLGLLIASSSPPHYQVSVQRERWEVQPGQNNVFRAVVLFLYVVKSTRMGHLSGVDLNDDLLSPIFDQLSLLF